MKFPRKNLMLRHPEKWLDALGRVWLFQEDFPMTETVRLWSESVQWDNSLKLVFILWEREAGPPLPRDGVIELQRGDQRRRVSISRIFDESGFKLAALIELV